jgi:hypothetical protein
MVFFTIGSSKLIGGNQLIHYNGLMKNHYYKKTFEEIIMTKAGKILALIGGLLTFLGTWAFSLFTVTTPTVFVNYGVGGVQQLIDMFALGVTGWPWQLWLYVIGYMLFLLSFILQLVGIKSRIAAAFGCIFPLALIVFIFLAYFGVWYDGFGPIFLFFSREPLVAQWVPMTFGFGLDAATVWPGAILDLGTFIVTGGTLLTLVSVFLTREEY